MLTGILKVKFDRTPKNPITELKSTIRIMVKILAMLMRVLVAMAFYPLRYAYSQFSAKYAVNFTFSITRKKSPRYTIPVQIDIEPATIPATILNPVQIIPKNPPIRFFPRQKPFSVPKPENKIIATIEKPKRDNFLDIVADMEASEAENEINPENNYLDQTQGQELQIAESTASGTLPFMNDTALLKNVRKIEDFQQFVNKTDSLVWFILSDMRVFRASENGTIISKQAVIDYAETLHENALGMRKMYYVYLEADIQRLAEKSGLDYAAMENSFVAYQAAKAHVIRTLKKLLDIELKSHIDRSLAKIVRGEFLHVAFELVDQTNGKNTYKYHSAEHGKNRASYGANSNRYVGEANVNYWQAQDKLSNMDRDAASLRRQFEHLDNGHWNTKLQQLRNLS